MRRCGSGFPFGLCASLGSEIELALGPPVSMARTVHPALTGSQAPFVMLSSARRDSGARFPSHDAAEAETRLVRGLDAVPRLANAEAAGDFDDLPGKGKPLENVGEVEDPNWWAKNLLRREGVSVTPPAIEIRRSVERFRERIGEIPSEQALRDAFEALNAEIKRLNKIAATGPPTTQAPMDWEAERSRWQAARSDSH